MLYSSILACSLEGLELKMRLRMIEIRGKCTLDGYFTDITNIIWKTTPIEQLERYKTQMT